MPDAESASCFISAEQLRGALTDTSPTIVFDCRFNLLRPHAGFQAYLDGHIPTARYAHLDKDLAAAPSADQGRHPLPGKRQFRSFLGVMGVDKDSLVVAYDDAGGAIAARLWWLLGYVGHGRRALLDGGLQAWQRASLPLATDLPLVTPAEYPERASLEPEPVTTRELEGLDLETVRLLDARAPARFRGEQEPIDPVAGHVPGAVNLPFDQLLSRERMLLPAGRLAEAFARAAGARSGEELIAMCGSGVTACLLIAGAQVAGLGHPRLYTGSWSEWIRSPDRPVATGHPGAPEPGN